MLTIPQVKIILANIFLKDFIYLFDTHTERENACTSRKGAEREGEAGSRRSREPDVRLYPMTWDPDLRPRQRLN